jgi:cytochrome P450
MELFQYAQALGENRFAHPADDLTTALMQAEVDGERLTAQEFGSFFILLVAAGNETTRNAISHGMKAFTDFPDQRRKWQSDFERYRTSAIEEIVRWATPVIHFRRTASRDTELGGQAIKAGQKVVMWYNSANRDELKFDDPYRFDIAREPNEHLGYGGGGPHFCLGANLARREIGVMFEELFRRLPDIEVSGEPDRLLSAFIHGIKRMPCRFTPGGRH